MASNAFDKWAKPLEKKLEAAGLPQQLITGIIELCWEAVKGHSSESVKDGSAGLQCNNVKCPWNNERGACGMYGCCPGRKL